MNKIIKPHVSIVVAMNKNRVIGSNNQLPWHIPEDLQYFKQITLGKPVIIGYNTFISIGRLLPQRKNIIVSRNHTLHDVMKQINMVKPEENILYLARSIDDAMNSVILNNDTEEICIIGGGVLYKETIDFADSLYITVIDIEVDNPTAYFPEIKEKHWRLESSIIINSKQGIICDFRHYIKSEIHENKY